MGEGDCRDTLGEARKQFFAGQNLPPDGGYNTKLVWVGPRRIKIPLPNVQARRRVVAYHDLHHVITGYGTDLAGEAELAGWEIGAGMPLLWEPLLVNSFAVVLGLILAPRRTYRAFVRGRNGKTLYSRVVDERLLQAPLEHVRRVAGIDSDLPPRKGSLLAFAAIVVMSVVASATCLALIVGAIVALVVVIIRHAAL